ncbi:MAG TPA: heavy-metal-associated domain-containing protein [Bacteroidia bacterium]|jgi:mercuric ion binding protein|nr:heavy-metal-associated domain-containing protein [Bacteroidia bacterium]
MKNIFFQKGWITIAIGLLISFYANSQNTIKTETFTVKGNCEQCQSRIENASDIKGVKISKWDVDKKILTVTYDSKKTSVEQIEQAIAKAGHDAGKVNASDADYKKLPACCQYKDHVCDDKKK